MTTERQPWTVGQLREELAKYPDDTPLRVAVSDPTYPNEIVDWDHVVLGAARGQEKSNGGQVTMTPFLILESYPVDDEKAPGVGE
ncbi:DUF6225 family protein [Streptomyces kaempferi]|uniref:DUF6225 family protein n=1 Tax=Streptomyces kaempferi TaxID=333725 RepID=A0ABW3XKI5_9ACTN